MNSFRTELRLPVAPFSLSHHTRLFTIGSCFSDSLGKRLAENKFPVTINPLGTLYDPISIHKALTYTLQNELPLPGTYLFHQGIWSNHDFHSSLSGASREAVEQTVANAIGTAHHQLRQANVLLITYGTARSFERIDTNEAVANCHKLPAKNFTSRLLVPEEIVDSLNRLVTTARATIPNLKIILTVSPVRHIKETLPINGVSKSILRWCCHQAVEQNKNLSYFPSYELLIDDLRDYRFYEPDMIHPSPVAIDYIWEKFAGHYLEASTQEVLSRWREIRMALNHRSFFPDGPAHQRFLSDTLRRLEELNAVLPVEEEIRLLRSQLPALHG